MNKNKNQVMKCWIVDGNYESKHVKFACMGLSKDKLNIVSLVFSPVIPNNNSKLTDKDIISINIQDKKTYKKVFDDFNFPDDNELKKLGKKILRKFGFLIIRNVS